MSSHSNKFLYVFLDEGGNLSFTSKGTKYFTLTAVSKERPFTIEPLLLSLKYDFVELGLDMEYFHASEDRQKVRNQVFAAIMANPDQLRIDSIVIEKRKTGRSLQPAECFYPRMLGHLLKYILNGRHIEDYDEIIVITDSLPVTAKRKSFEKGIKQTLSGMLPSAAKYRLLHHASKSSMGLQIADYCNWAIFRKWESEDSRSYDLIASAVKSEFELFSGGKKYYY